MDALATLYNWSAYESLDLPEARSEAGTVPAAQDNSTRSISLRGWDKLVGVAAFVLALSVVSEAWATTVFVNTPPGYALNARWGPSTDYGVHRRLWRGAVVETTGRSQNGWSQLIDGTWVAGNFIQATGTAVGSDRMFATVATPSGYALNARWGPGTQYGVYRALAPGETVELTGRSQNGWSQLIDTTWVASNFLQPAAGPITPSPNNPNPLPPNPNPQPPVSDPTVAQAQTQLKLLGYLPFNFTVTGVFDAQTQEAVRVFQRINGLTVDGQLGPQTMQALRDSTQGGTTSPPTPTADPAIAQLQTQLKILGYLSPNFVVNGILDNQTREAVRVFQQVNGLTADGIPGPETQKAINAAIQSLKTATQNPSPSPSPVPTLSPIPSPSPTPNPTSGVGQQMRVTTGGEDALVFSGPGSEFNLVRTLPEGSIVTTTGRITGNWSELSDSTWIFSLWLQPVQ